LYLSAGQAASGRRHTEALARSIRDPLLREKLAFYDDPARRGRQETERQP